MPALGYQVAPPRLRIIRVIPRFILVAAVRAFVASEPMDLGADDLRMPQARDEMLHLIKEFERLVDKSGLTVPAIRELLAVITVSNIRAWRAK